MSDTALTREEILEAAEDVLRRFGPTKTTVVDVARALGVSHGSVYRHFPSKAALRDAVAERWLARIAAPLASIAAETGPAPERLHRWLGGLIMAKQSRARQDPELFATYVALAGDARDVIRAHVDSLVGQLAQIIADGIARGELTPADPTVTARALFHATSRFHDPAHAARWSEPGTQEAFEAVWSLLLAGLTAPPTQEA
ncbi:MAG: TetR family transcriptional regulator [Anaerolineae bacterium]